MKTVLIYHENDVLDQEITARWLASFSELAGIVVLRETKQRMKTRVRRELARIGYWRFLDVLAFRVYYRCFLAKRDAHWRKITVQHYSQQYAKISTQTPCLVTHSPNAPEVNAFLTTLAPDIVIARCKTLLKKDIFSIATSGTFVFHPGVCPEYRNAHGCFWALANEDYHNVGMTLLKIDEGIDTGPIFGHYSYPFDASKESHLVIQARVVLENLALLKQKLLDIYQQQAQPIDVKGRHSQEWGQPWLSQYLNIKRKAQQRLTQT